MHRPDSPTLPWATSPRSDSVQSDTFTLLNEKLTVTRMPRLRASWYIIGLICLGSLFAEIVWQMTPSPVRSAPRVASEQATPSLLEVQGMISTFQKPEDLTVVAFVFYSSRQKTSILDCYLQRNLVPNGGVLDHVIFVPQNGNEEDLDWLELLAHSHPSYRLGKKRLGGLGSSGVNLAWQLVRPGTIYIHISSEIIFIDPTAIASLVETLLNHSDYSIVSGNIVNQATMSWIHHHLGVVRPYRPEMKPLLRPENTSATPRYDWRPSDLPTWDGPNDFDVPADFGVPTDFEPPFKGHRWLPLRNNDTAMNPLKHENLDVNGPGKWAWTTGALHHYSFLEHLEEDQLNRYKFPIWDFQHETLSPSFMAMWGQDIIDVRPMPAGDPDRWLSQEVSRKLGGRYPIADGRALAVHFAHENQKPGIPTTDLLDRYKAYADENVCL